MASFTVRIELTNADYDEYVLLHHEMEKTGFLRYIRSDSGDMYDLPDAEYNYEGAATADQILAMAKTAASKTGRIFAVLVTEATKRTWHGLEKIG